MLTAVLLASDGSVVRTVEPPVEDSADLLVGLARDRVGNTTDGSCCAELDTPVSNVGVNVDDITTLGGGAVVLLAEIAKEVDGRDLVWANVVVSAI